MGKLQAYIARLTCKTCAGVGSLTTKIHLVTVDGREISPKKITVRRCEDCEGNGTERKGRH